MVSCPRLSLPRGRGSTRLKDMERRAFYLANWLAALLLASLALSPLTKRPPADAASFYIAGDMALSGRIGQLYDAAAFEDAWRRLEAKGLRRSEFPHENYFLRPAFSAYLYAPLALLPFEVAWRAFFGAGAAAAAVLVWLLPRWFPAAWDHGRWRPWMAVWLPFVWALGVGQDTVLLALSVAAGVFLVGKGRQVEGGLVGSLCVIKPHLAWALPLAFWVCGKRKAAVSYAAAVAVFAAWSFAAVGFEGVADWRALLGGHAIDFRPEAMMNLRAVGIRLGQGPAVILGILTAAAFVRILMKARFEDAMAGALLTPLLLSPHSYPQDLAPLILLPFLNCAPTPGVAGVGVGGLVRWAVLLPWMYFVPEYRNWIVISLALGYLGYLALRPDSAAGSGSRAAGRDADPLLRTNTTAPSSR